MEDADPYRPDCTFDDGTAIILGTEYWFKCEPITWKILSSSGRAYCLVLTLFLDAHRYNQCYYGRTSNGRYENNYEKSEIREWLNGDFYKTAFALGNSKIHTVAVDNSEASALYPENSYVCSGTKDKIYLLSGKEYVTADYGFAPLYNIHDPVRQCKTSDWARANGAYSYTGSSYLYNGYYWTRSPYSISYYAWFVGYNDSPNNHDRVGVSCRSARPAITIKIA